MPRQPLDARENLAKEGRCQVTFGELQHEVPSVSDQPPAGLECDFSETLPRRIATFSETFPHLF
jgi:hypothetical protein